jgi:alcohol dehydrogenase class IV
MGCLDIPNETTFKMEMTPIKFGPGATVEVAYDLIRLGVKHTLIITDRGIMQLGLPDRVRTLIQEAGISGNVFDEVHVKPTDHWFEAIDTFERGRNYDGFVAVGGGSSIDSAKAANLFTTFPLNMVTLPPITGLGKSFSPPDYPQDEPIIPHGLSVVMNTPSTCRWTYPVSPKRHLRAAQLLGGNEHGLTSSEMPEGLPRTLLSLMRDTGIPNGLHALGYGEGDLSALKNSGSSSRVASNTGEKEITPEGLIKLCKQRMANTKYSRRIEIMEEPPKTATGKFLLREVCD